MQVLNRRKYMKLVLVVAMILMLCMSALAYPPDPDNAALLYYQAFLLVEQLDESMSEMVADLSEGKIEPNEEIREHIERSKVVIELATSASRIPHCDWGLKYSDGMSIQIPYLLQSRDLTRLIAADSRILTQEGDFTSALDRCLLLQRMARQVGKGILISYLAECTICRMSNDCIQNVLAQMPPDLKTLDWLKGKLQEIEATPLSLKDAIYIEDSAFLHYINTEKANELIPYLDVMRAKPELKKLFIDRITLVDDEFFRKNRDYWQNHMTGVRYAVKLPYLQACAKLQELIEQAQADAIKNPDATLTSVIAVPFFKPYSYGISSKTKFNAIQVAIDIYIARARTGKLPDKLPKGLPKDLFSGKDFEYEMTADGFILRCQGKDLVEDTVHEYEFKVAK